MSLAPHEQRVLATIETSLRSTDPALATMLETFKLPRPLASLALRIRPPGRRARVCLVVSLILAVFSSLICCGLMIRQPQPPRCLPPSALSRQTATCVPAGDGLAPASPPAATTPAGGPGLQP